MGKKSGGTGFLVAIPSKRWPQQIHHIHGVTNWHVAVHGAPPAPVIRVNRLSGAPEVFELDPSEWIFKPGSYDVAISPPLDLRPGLHKVEAVDISVFLTPEVAAKQEINAADDVFMVGRFVDYDGVEANSPAFRFGHISIIDARVKQETGYAGRSIVVDMHSRSGFSGSPVFVFRTAGSMFFEGKRDGKATLVRRRGGAPGGAGPYVIGLARLESGRPG